MDNIEKGLRQAFQKQATTQVPSLEQHFLSLVENEGQVKQAAGPQIGPLIRRAKAQPARMDADVSWNEYATEFSPKMSPVPKSGILDKVRGAAGHAVEYAQQNPEIVGGGAAAALGLGAGALMLRARARRRRQAQQG